MAFAAVASSKRAPASVALLKNIRLAAPSSSSMLGPAASVAAATRRRLHSFGGGGAPFQFIIGDKLVLYHHHLLAHFFHPMMLTSAAADLHALAPRRWWVSKDDEDAVEVQVAMLGVPSERVKVCTNKGGLLIKVGDEHQNKSPGPYSCHIGFSADEFDLDKAKAEMKDGLLKLTVPRVKGTEINIE